MSTVPKRPLNRKMPVGFTKRVIIRCRNRYGDDYWDCKSQGWIPHTTIELEASSFPEGTRVAVLEPVKV